MTTRMVIGLQKWDIAASLPASMARSSPCVYIREAACAPAGNPAVIPVIRTQPPAPGSLNIFFIKGSSSTPTPWAQP